MSELCVAEVPKSKRVKPASAGYHGGRGEEVELHYSRQILEKLRQRGGELEAWRFEGGGSPRNSGVLLRRGTGD